MEFIKIPRRSFLMRFLLVVAALLCLSGPAIAEASKDDTYQIEVKNVDCFTLTYRIDVHFFDPDNKACSNKWVKGIHRGDSKNVDLKSNGNGRPCVYRHEAGGTVGGPRDMRVPNHYNSVACWDESMICQCKFP
ncbi:MAG: hypothetical protein VYC38_08460 [Pseudomonadota bacterium]|nr:hypothetical protein [Pseudomonadota bacterium]